MTAPVKHATFTIERDYPVPPAKVFQAFADPKIKTRWFKGPDEWGANTYKSDFRVGGRESNRAGPPGGDVHIFDSIYMDIVTNERIVYCYDLLVGAKKISVSLATIELTVHSAGTHLTFTEQGAYLDGYDDAGSREHGTRHLLEQLAVALIG